jgi:predicted small lipoprotein YifL
MLKYVYLVASLIMPKPLLFLMIFLSLSACGTKGPLYVPEQRYPQGADNSHKHNSSKHNASTQDAPTIVTTAHIQHAPYSICLS